jgi:Predicted hydrolases or acyltransferases (alpha/beta hydrolase superfamily)
MYYNEFGNPESTTIVLLHNRANINSLYKLYSLQKKYHIIIPHINGNGEEINTDYTYKSATLDINTLIQSLHKDKVILIGHGMGADLILPILLKSPQFIEKAILISPDLFL